MASKCPKCDKTVYFGECDDLCGWTLQRPHSSATVPAGGGLTAGWETDHQCVMMSALLYFIRIQCVFEVGLLQTIAQTCGASNKL